VLINRRTLLFKSPIDGQRNSSVEVDVSAGSETAVLVTLSSVGIVANGVDGSDDTSSEFIGNSGPSSISFNFANAVSFSSLLINTQYVINYFLIHMNLITIQNTYRVGGPHLARKLKAGSLLI